MYIIEARLSPVALAGVYVYAADICVVSTADICPVSSADIYPASTENRPARGRQPAAVMSSGKTG